MNEKIEKPITIIRAELIQNLINIINNSELPLFVVESVLKDIYLEVKATAQKQYESDMIKYEQSKQEQLNFEQSVQDKDDSIEKRKI